MKRVALLALATFFLPAAAAAQETMFSYWVQYGAGGAAEVRAVVSGSVCPQLDTNLGQTPLTPRAAADDKFRLLCSAPLPAGATRARLLGAFTGRGEVIVDTVPPRDPPITGGFVLPLPSPDPARILVLGDTGCRIKGSAVQACNDPKAWPFAGLAQAAANLKPDLVIHLGDYLYRETPCPTTAPGCTGSPYGDNWETWRADFFAPAAPLLAAAPWIIVRGNHEDCLRAGLGFLRLLGPVAFDPATPCTPHLEPYAVMAGAQWIAVMDNASAPDTSVDANVLPAYQKDFATLTAVANTGPGHELWLTAHRPIWGAISGPLGLPIGGNATLIKAAGDLSAFGAISLMLSGHIHTFEAINYDAKVPPQIIAGHGGDNLDVTPNSLKGTIFQGDSGVHVKDGLSVHGFGFLMMSREAAGTGWSLQLYDSDGTPELQCRFEAGRVFCPKPG
jgi:hypothetical protein